MLMVRGVDAIPAGSARQAEKQRRLPSGLVSSPPLLLDIPEGVLWIVLS